jgi:hypothetical protein
VNEAAVDEPGPIDYVVVEFPGPKATFAGAMATELASLVDAELIRLLDLVIVEKAPDGTYEVREFEDLAERDRLGDLRAVEGQLAVVLAREDLDAVVQTLDAGTTAAVVVYENSWAEPLALAARRSGGELVASGRIPTHVLVDALDAEAQLAESVDQERGEIVDERVGRPRVIWSPVARTRVPVDAAALIAEAVHQRSDHGRHRLDDQRGRGS